MRCSIRIPAMPRRRWAVAAFALLLSTPACAKQTVKFPPMPLEVAAKVKEMHDFCREVGGKPAHEAFVIRTDLNRDGVLDYIVDENFYYCPPQLNPFAGMAGATTYLYIGSGNGRARLAFETGSTGTRVTSTNGVTTVFVKISGELCSDKVARSRADEVGCELPLIWNAETQTVELGWTGKVSAASGAVGSNSGITDKQSLSAFLTGTWEQTLIGTENDPGRCVSTPDYMENTIVKFHKSGRYEFFHQEGDSVGTWRASSGSSVRTRLNDYDSEQNVEIVSKDYFIVRYDDEHSSHERYRRCSWK